MDEQLNLGQLKKYAGLFLARQKLKAKEKEIQKRLDDMAPVLINHLLDHGIARLPLVGGRTISMSTRIWSKYLPDKTIEDLIIAAKEDKVYEKLGGKESISAQSLASYLKELDEENKPLPKNLAKVIEPNPVTNLVVKNQ